MKDFARIKELQRELRARLGGYFWLPCPRCGEMFGGNELGDSVYAVKDTLYSGKMVCFRHKAPGHCFAQYREEFRDTVLFDMTGDVVEIIPWDVEKNNGY